VAPVVAGSRAPPRSATEYAVAAIALSLELCSEPFSASRSALRCASYVTERTLERLLCRPSWGGSRGRVARACFGAATWQDARL
jgi:hypothetical protein